MSFLNYYKPVLGLVIWLALAIAVVWAFMNVRQASPSATRQLGNYLLKPARTHAVHFTAPRVLAIGDPVFLNDASSAAPVGRVSSLGDDGLINGNARVDMAWVREAKVTLFGVAPEISASANFELHETPLSTEWVLKTMLPPEKRKEIGLLIIGAYQNHTTEIVEAFRPVVQQSLGEAAVVIREDLKSAFARREETIQLLGKRFQSELIETELVPLLQDEIWPILKERSKPLASQIGTEVWQEMSVWRLGWRYLYDRSPLPDKGLAEKEFKRFVENKAAPILKAHINDFLELQKTLVEEFSANEQIRDTVKKSLKTVINDKDVQKLFSEVLQDVFVNNKRLEETMERYWRSDQARLALNLANSRLDPTIHDIGVALFGNPKTKITPEFARVLRNMVLHKDERWLILSPGVSEGSSPAANLPASFPVRYMGTGAQIPYAPARNRD